MSDDTFPRPAENLDSVDGLVDPDQENSTEGTLSYDDEPDTPAEEVDVQQEYGEVTAEDLSTDELVQDGSELVEDADASADLPLADAGAQDEETDRLVSEQAGGRSGEGAPSDPAVDHTGAADPNDPVDPTGPDGSSAEDTTEAPLADER
ncbi:hypothetical protein [Kytococcus sedentarius]|uniref:hypothetical protein n=1 Tax=Kytococcus sedentarius TaxID=1276 RepID=UPI0035BC8A10